MLIRLSFAAAGILAFAPVALAQSAPDAVAVDPTHHNVLFENDHVRVFRAMAGSGARSPMHSHPPFVFVGLGTTRLRLTPAGASPLIFDIHPEQVLWMDNAEHSWERMTAVCKRNNACRPSRSGATAHFRRLSRGERREPDDGRHLTTDEAGLLPPRENAA
jgi:hypothetical protein